MSKSWRDTIAIHPAAELFPLMPPDEQRVLGEDIMKNELRLPIVLRRPHPQAPAQLVDGRNRLDAIEIATGSPAEVGAPSITAGEDFLACDKVIVLDKLVDPWAYVVSANVHRRHLSAEQKREIIAKLIKADPSKSDRQIGEMIKADHKTVGAVRAEKEATREISPVEKRVGKDRKARKPPVKRVYTPVMHRAAKLGDDVVAKLKGTTLDNAREIDALVMLNRGAPEGEQTETVKRLITATATGKAASAIARRLGKIRSEADRGGSP